MIKWRLIVLILVSAVVTAALGSHLHGHVYPVDFSTAPLWRLFGAVGWVAGILWTVHVLGEPVERLSRRRWWNMGASDSAAAPDWDDMIHMLCDETCDPMILEKENRYPRNRGKHRFPRSWEAGAMLVSALAFGVLFGIGLDYLLYPRIPVLFQEDSGFAKLASLSTNLTAFLALIAATISILFTYQQLRAKVRAGSRQAWVKRVRKLVAEVLTHIHEITRCGSGSPHSDRFHKARTHLELHLNPAENDHRLLMFLIRACALPELSIANDRITVSKIANALQSASSGGAGRFNGRNIEALETLVSAHSREPAHSVEWRRAVVWEYTDELISFMFKLSHAILKREWERVRHTR